MAESLRAISYTVLIMISILYGAHLAKAKKQRKLSTFEFIIYISIGIAMSFFAISLLLFTFA